MLQASLQLYRNAYTGLSTPMWWLALVMFINRCGTMVIPFLTIYLTQKGFSLGQAGYVMGAFGAGSILGGYLGGRLTDRFGYLYVQVASLALNGVLFIVLAQMETLAQLMICIFILSSLGEAFRPANSAAIAAYSNQANRTRCYALNRLAINLGWAIGPAIGGILATHSYTALFWVDGLTCMAAAVLLLLLFTPQKTFKTANAEDPKPVKKTSAYGDVVFLKGMFLIFLVGLCFFQLFSMIPIFYKEKIGLNEGSIGWLLAMNGLIIAAVEMVLVYKLERKNHTVDYLILGSFIIGLSFLLLNIAPLHSVALAAMITVTFGEMLLFPFMNNFWVSRSNAANRGEYAALYTMAFSAAILLAPTAASQIAARAGFDVLWWCNFALCTIAAAGFYFLKKSMNNNERI